MCRWNQPFRLVFVITYFRLTNIGVSIPGVSIPGDMYPCGICLGIKPIFHWKWGSRWVPNANEIYTKNMKCTWPMPVFCIGTQRNLYSTDWRRGLASGKTQILALGNGKIYQHVGISDLKFWRRGHCPTPTPDARYFASQWNIGIKVQVVYFGCYCLDFFFLPRTQLYYPMFSRLVYIFKSR